jgi:hypothetical protein
VTDAYREQVDWYAKFGFIPIEDVAANGPQKMLLDMRTIRAAVQGEESG